jgi:hypothetical protein
VKWAIELPLPEPKTSEPETTKANWYPDDLDDSDNDGRGKSNQETANAWVIYLAS